MIRAYAAEELIVADPALEPVVAAFEISEAASTVSGNKRIVAEPAVQLRELGRIASNEQVVAGTARRGAPVIAVSQR